jgi:CRP-like cAMP-binding protein
MSLAADTVARELATGTSSPHQTNELLASLPREDYHRLSPHLRRVSLHRKQRLLRQGQPVQEIIFPVRGICSLVKTTENGHSIEIIGIGFEGAVGASVAWGQPETPTDVIVQIADDAALSLPLDVFKGELQRGGAVAALMAHYRRVFTTQLMQASACNALHSAEQRCCRWLLTTRDRIQADNFPITQNMVAAALGVRRPTVTLIMADLHRCGLIQYARGRVKVVDRTRLVSRACECSPSLSPCRQ